MSVRAKFKCYLVEDNGESKTIKLEAVVNGSPENEAFFRWTPSGQLTLSCVNPKANEQFVEGGYYYLDISKAE